MKALLLFVCLVVGICIPQQASSMWAHVAEVIYRQDDPERQANPRQEEPRTVEDYRRYAEQLRMANENLTKTQKTLVGVSVGSVFLWYTALFLWFKDNYCPSTL